MTCTARILILPIMSIAAIPWRLFPEETIGPTNTGWTPTTTQAASPGTITLQMNFSPWRSRAVCSTTSAPLTRLQFSSTSRKG